MQYKIDLILGDWSYDGHSLTKLITIDSNLDKAEIKQAHTTGCKNLQIDFNHVCCEYRNNRIPITVWNKFTLAGFYFEENKIRETDFKIFSQYTEIYDFHLFAKLYLFLVKQGDSTFEYTFVDNNEALPIGGYGLFID